MITSVGGIGQNDRQDSGKIKRLVYRMSSEAEPIESEKSFIPSLVVFLNMFLSPIIGILMAVRGLFDGKLSIFGICIRILYFIVFLVTIYLDDRIEKIERCARL